MKAPSNVFKAIGKARVRRSALDLTHTVKTVFYPGQLIPLPPIECIPGDIHKIRFNGLVRLQPLVTPVFENLKLRFYSFFVPYRLIWDDWKDFITRGEDGTTVLSIPTLDPADANTPSTFANVGSLWDYFGWQLIPDGELANATSRPIFFPHQAYWLIWNDYFRIPWLQDAKDFFTSYGSDDDVAAPAWRNWERDYFTSALPEAQLGVPPALPVFGSASAEFTLPISDATAFAATTGAAVVRYDTASAAAGAVNATTNAVVSNPADRTQLGVNYSDWLSGNNTVAGDSFSSVDINTLRLTWQLQVWQERNARGGSRYVEQLQSHYDVIPEDYRLQRPEYIGGSTTDIIIAEIPQTSATGTGTPQGNLAAQGTALPRGFVGSYRVKEHGLIMNIVCVTPKASYQQGIPRQWMRRTTFDYPFPEFAHLGEQAIKNSELFIADTSVDDEPFGFTGIYNEMRNIQNFITGQMRTGVPGSLDNWHMARSFSATPPLADEMTSMETALPDMMRPFAVQDEPPFISIFSVGIDCIRPLPYLAEPSPIGG